MLDCSILILIRLVPEQICKTEATVPKSEAAIHSAFDMILQILCLFINIRDTQAASR
jgi:hypothetical protein